MGLIHRLSSKSYWALKGWARGLTAHGYEAEMQRHLARLRESNAVRRRELDRSGGATTPGTVFVVVNIDTEGPCTRHERPTWEAVDRETTEAFSPAFRREFPDSDGNGTVLSWFLVDWTGATASARGRDLGYHRIFDRYRDRIAQARRDGLGDELFWHYHHTLPGDVESSNRRWSHHPQYEEGLCRAVLDRGWFPSCYRAGSTWESDEASAWLEQWMPFDFSNRSPQRGPHFDWSRAPTAWSVYAPSSGDYQRPGDGRRRMARCLSIEKNWFREEEVEAAFLDAAGGRDSYVSFFTHDYRPLCDYVRSGLRLIGDVARRYPTVRYQHAEAGECLRRLIGRPRGEPLQLTITPGDEIGITANRSLFGPQPWLASRDRDGTYRRLDCVSENAARTAWTVSRQELVRRNITAAAVGGCDEAGNSAASAIPL